MKIRVLSDNFAVLMYLVPWRQLEMQVIFDGPLMMRCFSVTVLPSRSIIARGWLEIPGRDRYAGEEAKAEVQVLLPGEETKSGT